MDVFYIIKQVAIGVAIGLGLSIVYIALNPHIRIDHDNHDMQAWFVQLPGYRTSGSPESEIDLREWVGTKIEGESDEDKDPQVVAGETLIQIGVFPDHEVQKRADHWVLYKPATSEKFFSWKAFYQVTPWHPVPVSQP